jgi:hypothetical protein
VIPVLFEAVAVYVTLLVDWQIVEEEPKLNTGIVTGALTVTVCVDDLGPLHPDAVAVITDVPDQAASHVTSPVEELMVLPPDRLAASRLYTIPVLVVAVAEYVTVPAARHLDEVDPRAKTGKPTVGVVVTV